MQLAEQGLIELDAPANDYLRAFQLMPAKASWRPATVRHLLTHTAGVPEWLHPSRMINSGWVAETFSLEERLPTLAEYYQGGLRLAAEPGTIWTYSAHLPGPALHAASRELRRSSVSHLRRRERPARKKKVPMTKSAVGPKKIDSNNSERGDIVTS
jgi:hypothetical protein